MKMVMVMMAMMVAVMMVMMVTVICMPMKTEEEMSTVMGQAHCLSSVFDILVQHDDDHDNDDRHDDDHDNDDRNNEEDKLLPVILIFNSKMAMMTKTKGTPICR